MQEQIECMGQIYTASDLTLFAAAGVNSDFGLSVNRDPAILRPSKVLLHAEIGNWSLQGDYFFEHFRPIISMVAMKENLPLFKRGWVLQEEVLSARGLYFGREQMTWRCLCESSTKEHPACPTFQSLDHGTAEQAYDTFMGLRLSLRTKNLRVSQPSSTGCRGVLNQWYKMVEKHSERQLTKCSDVLPALSGIVSRIHELHGYSFVAGLWQEDLQLGLTWKVNGDSTPGMIASSYAHDEDFLPPLCASGNPSWSWVSQFCSGRSV
ncbi:hypothetical protein K402DRAFT_216605 [Aulographum hederae CBS 113979]|uniref:Heterokaryon incompatibility domain-containing protein n=1 Tax=Aulographum hederae CBS 113979 TaxID=1176131 RepID=A0A6G1GM24_9PEZI|nr:hypothetical protein K402DRAFT_216605 [Aulographum hederae CBS 113979]